MELKDTKNPEQLIFHLLNVLYKQRRDIGIITGMVVLGALVYCLLAHPIYRATSTLLPANISQKQMSSQISGLADMAKSLGFGSFDENNPLSLYPSILESRLIKTEILHKKFKSRKFKEPQPLYAIMGIKGKNQASIDHEGFLALSKNTSVGLDRKTGIITLTVEAYEPQLAADITNAFIDELKEYNSKLRTKHTRQNRIFIEGRLNETKQQLTAAENKLKIFRESNKRITNSPELQMELGRLLREVRIKEEVYLTLNKQYELAKIDEQKSTPVINILDKAIPPVEKSKPPRRKIILFALLFGIVSGIGWALIKDFLSTVDKGDKEYRELILNIDNAKNKMRSISFNRKETVLK